MNKEIDLYEKIIKVQDEKIEILEKTIKLLENKLGFNRIK